MAASNLNIPEAPAIEGAKPLHSGKVRDLYELPDGNLLMVASDRISAFDFVLDTPIPDKGELLTRMSLWWFDQLKSLVNHHVVSTEVPASVRGRAVVCEALEMYPVECVARGYISGSGWKDYVATGGSVLATLGTRTAIEPGPLLEGWRISEPQQRTAAVGEIATTHPVLREAGDWHSVRFFRHRAVQIGDDDKVLIAYEDGSPLLIERTIGAGRVLVLTTPVEREWNDLAIHPLFVRFIAEAARYLVRGDASAASTTVGSVVLTGLTAAGGGQIFDPQGGRVLGLAQSTAADRLIPDQTGFYEIRGNDGVRWVAVNVDARESDLTPLPASFVQRWRAMQVRQAVATNVATAAAVTPTADAKPRSLGSVVLWLAAALLLAELLLANRYLAIRRETPK